MVDGTVHWVRVNGETYANVRQLVALLLEADEKSIDASCRGIAKSLSKLLGAEREDKQHG